MKEFRRMSFRLPSMVLFIVCAIILTGMFAAPFLNTAGLLTRLDGSVGVIDHEGLWDSLDTFSSVIYTLGDFGCHQEESRTLMFNGNEMPMCIRDVFIFVGFAIGLLFHFLREDSVFYRTDQNFFFGAFLVLLTLMEWSAEHYFDLGSAPVRAIVSVVSGFGAIMMMQALFTWENDILESKAKSRK